MFSFSGDGQDYDYEIGGSFGDTSGPEVQILPTTFTVTQTVFATGDVIFLPNCTSIHDKVIKSLSI